MLFASRLVNRQVKSLAEYLLDRFLGPYLEHKIDLKAEGTQLGMNTLVLNDIALRCELLNEKVMADSPLKFLKFRIGQIKINIEYTNVHVSVQLSDLQVDLLTCELKPDGRRKSQQKTAPNDHASKDSKEEYLVDRLFFSKLLQNLELQIKNIAVRVVLQDSPLTNSTYVKPTLLLRVNAFNLQKISGWEQQQEQSQAQYRVNDLQRVFGNKQLSLSDVSVHLMKDSFLSLSEDLLAMQQLGHFSSLSAMASECQFPFQYPFLNHPSTIFLLKAPKGGDIDPVRNNDEWYSPSFTVLFKNAGQKDNPQGTMEISCRLPLAECTISFTQVRVLHATLGPFLQSRENLSPRRNNMMGNPNDLMKSVLDFSLMEGLAGIEGVDINELELVQELYEPDESLELQQELKQILQKQKARRQSKIKRNPLSTVRASLDVGQLSFQLICHDEMEAKVDSDRIFKSMGFDVVQEYIPVGAYKCPWYELNLAKLSSTLTYEIQKLSHEQDVENLNVQASIGQLNLHRFDLIEKKVKVQLGGNIKQTNHLARKDYSIDDSDDQSNFQSCLSSLLETSHYHMAQEFNESMDCSEMFFDATHTLSRINSEPHKLRKPVQTVNNFQFLQLTKVLRYQDIDQSIRQKGETELHLCSKLVFELVHLQQDENCFTVVVQLANQTSKQAKETTSSEIKVSFNCGKIYFNPGLQDILTALQIDSLFATSAWIHQEAIFIPNLTHLESSCVSQGPQSKMKVEITARIDALEASIGSFNQMQDYAALMCKFDADSPIQDLLQTVGCSCNHNKDKNEHTSISIQLSNISLKSNFEDLSLTIYSLEVLGTLGKDKIIQLLSAEHLTVKQEGKSSEPSARLQKLVSLDQIVEELRNEESKQTQPTNNEPKFVHTSSGNDLVASKSSSVDPSIDSNLNFVINKAGIFDIETSAQRPTIRVKRITLKVDQSDTKNLVSFGANQEAFFKTIINAVDISNIKKIQRTVEQDDRQRYFEAKRRKKGIPLSILFEVDDILMQVYATGKQKVLSKEILKIRLNRVALSVRFQDRGLLTNIRIGLRVQEFIVIDKVQSVYMNYQPQAKVPQEGPRLSPDNSSSSFQEELEYQSQYLLIHPAYVHVHQAQLQDSLEVPRQERKVLKALVDIAFINKSFFEERTTSQFISNKLESLKNKRPVVVINQLAQDFGELKTNPMQLKIQCQIQNLVIPVSNQNMRLQAKLAKLGAEFQNCVVRIRQPNLRDLVQDPACKPPQEFFLLEKQRFEVDINDITVLYTPILKKEQAEQILFIREPTGKDAKYLQDGETKVRMPYGVALQIFSFRLKSTRSIAIAESGLQSYRPKAKHLIENQSFILHFLHKQTSKLWPDDLLQAKSLFEKMRQNLAGYDVIQNDEQTQDLLKHTYTTTSEELAFRGFIPLLSVLDVKINAKSNCFHFTIGSLTVSLAGDSLRHFMDFCKLVQLSMVDELKQLEQLEEEISDMSISQTDSLAVSAYHRFEQQQALKLSNQSQQHRADYGKMAYLKEISQSQLNHPGETFDCNPNPYFSKDAQEQSQIMTMLSKSQVSNYAEIQSEIFIVDGDATHGLVQQPRRSKNPFAKSVSPPSTQNPVRPALNIASLIVDDYFVPLKGQQEEDRFRRIHQREFESQTKDKFCSFEFTFELSSIIVQIHEGKDFDFDLSPQPFKTFEGLGKFNQIRRVSNSQISEKSAAQTKPFDLEDDFFKTHSNAEEQIKRLLITDLKQSLSQKRKETRKSSDFMRLQLQDLLLSRRQYPDKALMQVLAKEKQLRMDGLKGDIPKVGKKLKTLGLSLRTLQVQLSTKGHRPMSLFNHPYHYRFHNFFEFKDYSERSYKLNVEEHQVHLFLSPTHITLSQEPINFIIKILPDPNPQQVIRDEQDFVLLEYTIGVQAPKVSTELKHAVKHLIIKESSLTISVAGVFSKYIQVRDLTLNLKEFKLNCTGLANDDFYSEVLEDNIQLVGDSNDVQSLPFEELLNRVVFFYRNDIVANQKLAILSGFRPIQAIKYAGGSLLSPLYKPLYKAYHMGYLGLIFGLREGVQDFYGMLEHGSKGVAILAIKNISKL